MNMTQDNFNRLITFVLLVFFMAMFLFSYITGRNMDLTSILAFLVPLIANTTHVLVSNITSNKTNGANNAVDNKTSV